MLVAELLETLMVICLSTSWYWSIRQVWQAQDSRGMSRIVPAVVLVGCLFGLGSKVALYHATGHFGLLILLYAWNAILSAAQLYLIVKFDDEIETRRFVGVDPAELEQAAA